MTTRLIDIHPHIISPDTTRYPLDPLGGERSGWSATRPATFEQYAAAMDAVGIDKAAIVHSSTTYGFDNSYVADSIAAQPKRYAGVYSVDMLAPDATQKIRYWTGRGLAGLRIFTTGSTMPGQAPTLEDPALHPAWGLAGELGIPVCVQITKAAIPALEKLLTAFPGTLAIVDHMMKPDISSGPPYAGAQHLFDLARFKNLYLKLSSRNTESAYSGKATPETFFGRVVQEFGADRIAWGSNFPAAEDSLADIVKALKDYIAFLPAADQHWIMAGTAQKLYPVLKD
ncbi:MAG: amidohydrolase [Bordetella sp. SCN 67-23]|nr:amidohydrolase family protein [Burkholderiales bacterium]ODS73584.1 MAG: amidohydrolase [Bordetella sp. SCN 67-23]ODU88519.1 MAG: amidohydrolase [Bordetella sp. SCN 68-11]OJW89703.1 MAG: amidohydrolase [Burkholderiales bacterium 67-32]